MQKYTHAKMCVLTHTHTHPQKMNISTPDHFPTVKLADYQISHKQLPADMHDSLQTLLSSKSDRGPSPFRSSESQ